MSLAMRPNEVNTEVQYDCKVEPMTDGDYSVQGETPSSHIFICGGTEHEKELDGDRIHP